MTIVSHKHKYIFLKSRKTAGTSIEALLARYVGPQDILAISHDVVEREGLALQNENSPRYSIGIAGAKRVVIGAYRDRGIHMRSTLKFHQHMTAREVKESVGPEVWNNYKKITIERDPYERLISFWRWRTSWFGTETPFDQFARAVLSPNPLARVRVRGHGFSNRPFYMLTPFRSVAVDYVIRYESLQSDLLDIAHLVGVPKGEVLQDLPTYKGRGSHYDISEYYSGSLLKIARKKFALEQELFGYSYAD